jgi:hypothetical protein
VCLSATAMLDGNAAPDLLQGSSTSSRLTNAEVIQLVSGGLSATVIAASIRQTASVAFDLTPAGLIALKKAGVPDAVIAAMQERNGVAAAAVAATPERAPAADTSLPGLARSLEAGAEIRVPVKYNSACQDCKGVKGLYAARPMIAVYMADGTLKLTKTTLTFDGSVGAYDFTVGLDKILLLEDQPEMSSRIHLTVALPSKNGREDKKNYYFYNPAARGMGDPSVEGRGQSIVCTGCDDSLHNFYMLLNNLLNR